MSGATKTSDLLVTPEAAVAWLAAAHEHLKGPFNDKDFERLLREIPDMPKTGWFIRVPVWYDPTVEQTFERQVQLLRHQYGNRFYHRSDLKSDEEHLRLLGGNDRHPSQCLRWEVINLNPNPVLGHIQRPIDVRHPDKSPHAGVLAFVAQNKEYGFRMNGKDEPYLWVPGYEVTNLDHGPWIDTPYLCSDYTGRPWVRLCAYPCGGAFSHCSVPYFLES